MQMFVQKDETSGIVLMCAIVCIFMLGVYLMPTPKPMASVIVFLIGVPVAGMIGAILAWQASKERYLGKLVGEKDLVSGRYLIGKTPNGQIVISQHLYAVRCTEGAPGVRLFDHTTSAIPAQYFRDLPVGGSLWVEMTFDGGQVRVGMAA